MPIQQILLGTGSSEESITPPGVTSVVYFNQDALANVGDPPQTRNVSSGASGSGSYNWGTITNTTGTGGLRPDSKRYYIIIANWRQSSGPIWSNLFGNTYSVGLKRGNGSYNIFSYLQNYAASTYNATSVWRKFLDDDDISSSGDFSCKMNDVQNNAPSYGEFSYTGIVLDNVSNVKYSVSGKTPDASGTMNETQDLSVTANNSTTATKVLRIVASNASNISHNVLDYNKGASEPNYTKIGEGDNGSDERNWVGYWFGDHGTQVNMTGNFGNGTTNASDGIAGMGLMIGFD